LSFVEEFSIYMNYVRKLGFEETPDYDFLRELFTKVLKTLGEPEDGVFDWMLLNGGKGWEAGNVSANVSCCYEVLFFFCLSMYIIRHHPTSSLRHMPMLLPVDIVRVGVNVNVNVSMVLTVAHPVTKQIRMHLPVSLSVPPPLMSEPVDGPQHVKASWPGVVPPVVRTLATPA
jgi:hypothetical protein